MPAKDGKESKPNPQKANSGPVISEEDMVFQNGLTEGSNKEANRVKESLRKRYEGLQRLYDKEVNIGTRYELKLRMEEITQIFENLFGGEN
jgi:hypothetical protein